MNTVIDVQVTPQGLLIPHALVAEWVEVEAIKSSSWIIIQPKHLAGSQEREAITRALRTAKLTSPLNNALSQSAMPVSPARRAELARALAVGRALSDIVLEERTERW